MKLTSDKKTTTLVKKFLKKKGMLTIPCQFQGFGDCVIRFVSVSESDKWNWKEQNYSRYINFEIIMKRNGELYSESRIPNAYWRESKQRFFKNRKYMAQMHINQMLSKTKIPMFMEMASISISTSYGIDLCGNVTYKYID